MNLDQALTQVAILGAAGKMGRGIALLILQEMAMLELEQLGEVGTGTYQLYLIDLNASSFLSLQTILQNHLLKYAEKNINALREGYKSNPLLVSNEEIIEAFVKGAQRQFQFSTEISLANKAYLIFEAVVEDIEMKVQVLQTIARQRNDTGFFLSNTSSIPIHLLNEKASLNHRILGFHFYNPPTVQKLLEMIIPPETNKDLVTIAYALAKRLKKKVVNSKDTAGFIGNGYMIREIIFACQKVDELALLYSLPEAIYMVNRISQDWLLRPMGIFQLIDFVGINVCQQIISIMSTELKDPTLKSILIERMLEKGILGGQNSEGMQKEGFFAYEKHILKGIYSLPKGKYTPFTDATWIITSNRALGEMPPGHLSWKSVQKESHSEQILKSYLENLDRQETLGAQIARDFLHNSCQIAAKLVNDGIASSFNDVDTVLMNGFYHLYGVDLLKKEIEK